MADWRAFIASLETAASFPPTPDDKLVDITYHWRNSDYSSRRYLMPGYLRSYKAIIATTRQQQLDLEIRLDKVYGSDAYKQNKFSSLTRSRMLIDEARQLEIQSGEERTDQGGEQVTNSRCRNSCASAIRKIMVRRPGKKKVRFFDGVPRTPSGIPRTPGGMQVPGTPGYRTNRAQKEEAEHYAAMAAREKETAIHRRESRGGGSGKELAGGCGHDSLDLIAKEEENVEKQVSLAKRGDLVEIEVMSTQDPRYNDWFIARSRVGLSAVPSDLKYADSSDEEDS